MRTIILLLAVLTVGSCASRKVYYGEYDLSLKSNIEGDIEGLKFSDDVVDISWWLSAKSMNFELYNKSDNPIKIIWDDVIYVDQDGKSNKTIHEGVMFINSHSSQPPTTIAGGSKVIDRIVPSDNLYYVSGYNSGWREKSLLPSGYYKREGASIPGEKLIGKEIKVLIPIEMEGEVINYTFVFNIDNFRMSN